MPEYYQTMKVHFNFKQDKPLSDIIYEGLRSTIVSGLIPPGERLNEKRLSAELKISRTPLRDAIHRLQYEGLLDYVPKVGSRVRRVSVADVSEIYQLRLALEQLAVSNAMGQLTKADYDKLDDNLAKTRQAMANKDLDRVVTLSQEFNQVILQAAGMPRLTQLLTQLKDYLHRFRTISMNSRDRGPRAIEEHQEIVNAMRASDLDKIHEALVRHLSYSKDTIQAYLVEENRTQDEP